MYCPVCAKREEETTHRECILQLFRENKIKSLKEWKALLLPKKTKFLGWEYQKLG